ncbi:DNA-binding transcriptional LysR family regulator [Gallaecimonas pentaromativorans]|uniref:DNA-binding transcriptional LysR family regulator n=2 Tax=Gallaecimonas pentaromativorans TaxID=584787 RepID=A0A3N1PNT6_9GAMM|nr:DNA-binding transcriptional LysR family regulator [Gallaecimonas pentaromativorans]
MQVLIAVSEQESFSAAAQRLGMSAPSVTRAISAMESRLGILLLARTTRSVRLTDAGRRYVEDCKRILSELHEAEELAAGNQTKACGQLLVTAPVLFGELYVVPLMAQYLAKHSEVNINAMLVDRVVNLIDEGVDVAFRIGNLPDGGMCAVTVGHIRPVICAAPSFLDRRTRPARPSDLIDAPVVQSSASALLTEWQFQTGQGTLSFHPQSRLVVNSNQAAINAASLGWGFTRVLSYQVADKVAAGELEIVLDEFETPPLPIRLFYQGGRMLPAKVTTFVDHCVAALKANPALQLQGRS